MEKNNEIKNKIITLSGQPVSGKGTAVKLLKDKLLESQKYKEEDIHVISTGEEYRKHFNLIVDIIKDPSRLSELAKFDSVKSLFKNHEYKEAFMEALIAMRSYKKDLSNFTIQDANDLPEFKDIRRVIDTIIDQEIKEKGIEIKKEKRDNEIWVIDSRLAFYNIPDSFSVRLTSSPEVAGERLFNDKKRGEEDNQYQTVQEAIKERERRRVGEQKRYKSRYGIDLEDESNYDLIIDTSYAEPTDVADTILNCLECSLNNEAFSQKWASPKSFIPLQSIMQTAGTTEYSFNDLSDIIRLQGYIPSKAIEVVTVDGIPYIIEGHHRNFCAVNAGKTLVPYEVIAKDDEKVPNYAGGTARQRAESARLVDLYDHEEIFRQTEPDFSYNKIYPGIYQHLEIDKDDIDNR